jgi:16S rRNA (cytidine1402-2'-O)-methyltransferase
MEGTLFVVATPIGNLEDITLRALRVLKEADIIVCEDTRKTANLLRYYNIPKKPLISYYKGVEKERHPRIIALLKEGKKVALCSEAGTPLISDPGALLVRRAHEEGIKIEPVPGPSALTAALQASGIDAGNGFIFLGFLPRKKKDFKEVLKYFQLGLPVVVYISPHRFNKEISTLYEKLGERRCFLAREITKLHEELTFSSLSELKERENIKGEITLIIFPEEKRR